MWEGEEEEEVISLEIINKEKFHHQWQLQMQRQAQLADAWRRRVSFALQALYISMSRVICSTSALH